MPTLTQLEYIIAVDRERHFGKAARACHVSQPSLSAQIQKVEEELGFVLFDRLKKPVLPTERGRAFIEQARIVLHEQQKLLEIASADANVPSGNFRLGIIPTIAPYLLPLFIEAFSQAYPRVLLKVDELKTENILRELNDDALDAAILATPLHEEGLRERRLYYEPFHLYVGKEHKLAVHKKVREDELDAAEMWLLQDGHCFRQQASKICSRKNEKSVFANIEFEGGNLETLRYLIREGRGYTLVPELFVTTLSAAERQTHVRDFATPVPSREVSLVFRRNQWKSDILKAIELTVKAALPLHMTAALDRSKNHRVGM